LLTTLSQDSRPSLLTANIDKYLMLKHDEIGSTLVKTNSRNLSVASAEINSTSS